MALVKDGDAYVLEDLTVLPTLNQDLLGMFYLAAKREKVLDLFYYQNTPPTLGNFLLEMTAPNTLTLGGFVKHGTDHALVGLGRMGSPYQMGNGFQKAEISQMFLKQAEGKNTLPLARMMIEWIFDHTYPRGQDYSQSGGIRVEPKPMSVFFGVTPVQNRPAMAFMKRMKFQHVGPIAQFATWKNELTSVYLSWMTRERWQSEISPFRNFNYEHGSENNTSSSIDSDPGGRT